MPCDKCKERLASLEVKVEYKSATPEEEEELRDLKRRRRPGQPDVHS